MELLHTGGKPRNGAGFEHFFKRSTLSTDDKLRGWQSDVIVEYIGETTGKMWPTDRLERYRAKEWLAWELDLLFPGISMPRVSRRSRARWGPRDLPCCVA